MATDQDTSLITLYRISRRDRKRLQLPTVTAYSTEPTEGESTTDAVDESMTHTAGDYEQRQPILDTNTLKWQSWVSNGRSPLSQLSHSLTLTTNPTSAVDAPTKFNTSSSFHGKHTES